MISSKEAYYEYLKQDQLALGRQKDNRPRILGDEIWKLERLLRRVEYYKNCKQGPAGVILRKFYGYRFHRLSVRLGMTLPVNVFGPGLSIAHYGTIVVHAGAKIGRNCRLQEGVTIGATGGSHEAAVIGNNCYFGSGAKVIGAVRIADDVGGGAYAVGPKAIGAAGNSWAGGPGKNLTAQSSRDNLNQSLFAN